jgi:hypothetical protein
MNAMFGETEMETVDFDELTRGQVNARRNYLMGLWAGNQLGLQSSELTRYVQEVMLSDFEEPGPQDVIRKVRSDLAQSGISLEEAELMNRFATIERDVRAEMLSTD